MNHTRASAWDPVVTWWRIAFATHLLYSGIAYASVGWVPMDMIQGKVGIGDYLNILNAIGMYPLVKYFEIVAGFFLLINRGVPLILVVHMPITMTITYLNLVLNPHERHIYTGIQEFMLHVPLLVAYGGYYAPFLRWKTRPWWLLQNMPATAVEPGGQASGLHDRAGPAPRPAVAGIAVVVVASLLILAGSQFMSLPPRQLPPRDWVPLITGGLAFIWEWRRVARAAAANA